MVYQLKTYSRVIHNMNKHREPLFTEKQWEELESRLELPLRQSQVIRQLFEARSDKQIAEAIGVSLPTVRSHLCRLYNKFNVQDRTELVLYVMRELLTINAINHEGGIKNGN